MRVKIFNRYDPVDMQDVINAWILKANPSIIDTQFSTAALGSDDDGSVMYSVAIWYEDAMKIVDKEVKPRTIDIAPRQKRMVRMA